MGVYTSFKIPVATEDPHSHQVPLVYRLDNLIRQRTTVTNAGHTPIANQVEPVRGWGVRGRVCDGVGSAHGEGVCKDVNSEGRRGCEGVRSEGGREWMLGCVEYVRGEGVDVR